MKTDLPIQLSGAVIHGEKVGRTIGFPTANLDLQLTEKDLEPGVYFGTCTIESAADQRNFFCLTYFGPRYIFGEERNSFEVYIYDFDQEVYGKKLIVKLTDFMRAPLKISSLEELRQQLTTDKNNGTKLLHDRQQ